MARSIDCPNCGEEIPPENYQSYDPDCGVFSASWICDKCDHVVVDDDDGSYLDELERDT